MLSEIKSRYIYSIGTCGRSIYMHGTVDNATSPKLAHDRHLDIQLTAKQARWIGGELLAAAHAVDPTEATKKSRRVTAAAPQMLKALEVAADMLAGYEPSMWADEDQAAYREIQAAIAAATGEGCKCLEAERAPVSGTNLEIYGLNVQGSLLPEWVWKIENSDEVIAVGTVESLPGTYDLDGKDRRAEAERVACCVGHCNGLDVTKMAILLDGEAIN